MFISPSPYPSWILNETTGQWEAPVTQPELTQEQIDGGYYYTWDEESHNSDNTTGWTLIQLPSQE
jgi:hypothetical protein